MDGAAEELAARSTVWDYLDLWDWDGTLERIHHALYVEVREQAGREARVIGSWPVTLSSLRTGSYEFRPPITATFLGLHAADARVC